MRKHMVAATFALAASGMNMHTAACATRYNAVGGFGTKSNPSGPWSYLASGTLLPQKTNIGNIKNWIGWWNGQGVPNGASIARNKTGATITYLTIVDPVDHLNNDPESIANVTARFTVPTAGQYTVSGDFRGNDTAQVSHPVEIDHNGAAVFSATIASYGQLAKFKVKVTAAAGDTIDFVTKTGASYSNLSTGLKATLAGP